MRLDALDLVSYICSLIRWLLIPRQLIQQDAPLTPTVCGQSPWAANNANGGCYEYL